MQLDQVAGAALMNTEAFPCSDDFFILQGWEQVGEVVREWCRVILPATEFNELESDVTEDAKKAFVDECSRIRIPVDHTSYRFTGFLNRHWEKYVNKDDLGERLEQAKARLAVRWNLDDDSENIDLLKRNSADDILETYPLEQEWGFSDEYDYCMECVHSIRTSPDCYDWTLQAWFQDAEGYLCPECIDADEYLEAKKNTGGNCDRHLVDPGDHGWERLLDVDGYDPESPRRFENGLHGGQDDDPGKQMATLNAGDIDVLFTLYPSQFYVAWELWVPEGNADRAWELLSQADVKADIDPATVMRQQLEGYSAVTREKGESMLASDGEAVNIPQEWMARHPTCRMDPPYWIEFKKRHDALPQPVADTDWLKLAETLDTEFAGRPA